MFYNIQALRGIAALLVLFHHSLPHFKAMNISNIVFESIAKFGFLGVDIFFVISGFVMAKTTIGKPQNLNASVQFILKRFLRIFLGFWPIMLLALIYYYLFNPSYLDNKEIVQSLLLVNANMFDLVIAPAWSLTYELYFYLIVAFVLLSAKLKPQLLFGTFIVFIVFKIVYSTFGQNKLLDFFFSALVLEFIAGYALFFYLDKLTNKNFMVVILLATIGFLYLAINFNITYGHMRVLTYGVFSLLIVWLFVSLEKNSILTLKGMFKSLGDSSYTLYLTHTVLLGMLYTIGLRDYLVGVDFAMIGFIIYLILIVTFSWVLYKVVELPLYTTVKKHWIKSD